MNPAFSVIVFTTVVGAAQGLVVGVALAILGGVEVGTSFLVQALVVATTMLVAGLGASFLHLGRPARAWRAATMWRTSWLSREVIVLPAFIGVVVLWLVSLAMGGERGATKVVMPILAIGLAVALWYCTAMIYACLRFIEEWAHPLTVVNFMLAGLASGLLLLTALAATLGAGEVVHPTGLGALASTIAAWLGRVGALHRNARIRHRSTLQSATGIRAPMLVQTSMGMSAGSFNTREFFHGGSAGRLRSVKSSVIVLGGLVPAALAFAVCDTGLGATSPLWLVAVTIQATSLLADRWLFFAQGKHPQNLYYQVAS